MISGSRWLLAACAALLVAGLAGTATHQSHQGRPGTSLRVPKITTDPGPGSSSTARIGTKTVHSPVPTTTPGATRGGTQAADPGPNSTTLAADMITPTDMGGYYQISAENAQQVLGSAPCLVGSQPSPAQSGHAQSALLGPDQFGVPAIVEVVLSYPGSGSRAVYQELTAAVGTCTTFPVDFGGTHQTVPIKPGSIPPVGDADQVWQGTFSLFGRTEQLQIGLVLQGQLVLGLVYVDSVPPSAAIMGNFTSTLSLAIGKLA